MRALRGYLYVLGGVFQILFLTTEVSLLGSIRTVPGWGLCTHCLLRSIPGHLSQ